MAQKEHTPIPGETNILSDVKIYEVCNEVIGDKGVLTISNYGIKAHYYTLAVQIFYNNITTISKSTSGTMLVITIGCKDFRRETIAFKNVKEGKQILSIIARHVSSSTSLAVAINNAERNINAYNTNNANNNNTSNNTLHQQWRNNYSTKEEFSRQNINEQQWHIIESPTYDICSTYPNSMVVPLCVTSNCLINAAKARNEARLPLLCYYFSKTNTLLLRSNTKQANCNNTLLNFDVHYLQKISAILDNKITAINLDNKSTTILSSAHNDILETQSYALPCERDIQRAMQSILLASYTLADSPSSIEDFSTNFKASHWCKYLEQYIQLSDRVATQITNGTPYLLESREDLSKCACIAVIVQLLLDPYFRTVDGFTMLLEKEFILCGYNFNATSPVVEATKKPSISLASLASSVKSKQNSKQVPEVSSASFVFTLNAVFALMLMEPNMFEFNNELLLFIVDALFNGNFGNFLCCSAKARELQQTSSKTNSLWDFIKLNKGLFVSEMYNPNKQPLALQSSEICDLPIWNNLFLRYASRRVLQKQEKIVNTIIQKQNLGFNCLQLRGLRTPYLQGTLQQQLLQPLFVEQITSTDFSSNLLVQVPGIITSFSNLRTVILNNNRIRYFPSSLIEQFSSLPLESLDLSYNQLRILPSNLCSLQNLQQLNLSHNSLTNCDFLLKTFTNLTEVDVSFNLISSIDAALGSSCQALKSFNIEHNNISYIPDCIYGMQFTCFKICNNNWLNANAAILQNQQLEKLSISNNVCTTITDNFNALSQLRELCITNANLSTIPASILQLSNLTTLNLANNSITTLWCELVDISSLTSLTLDDNKITRADLNFGKLTSLKVFSIANNPLRNLPASLGQCENLVVLDIRNTKIRRLHCSIGYLERLRESKQLLLSESIQDPPPTVIALGHDAIFQYLRELGSGTTATYHAKVCVVGPLMSGKSHLVSNIVTKLSRSRYNPNLFATHGIEVTKAKYNNVVPKQKTKEQSTERVSLAIWDFSGNAIALCLQESFLNDICALFIVVWNINQHDLSQVEYWLQIAASNKNSQIILVATHSNDCKQISTVVQHASSMYKQRFPNLQAILAVDNANCTNIEALLDVIKQTVSKLPTYGELAPTPFLELSKVVEQPYEPTKMAVSELEQQCKQLNITNVKAAISFLSSEDSLIHFDDNSLRSWLFGPEWLFRLLETLITTKHMFAKNGILQHQHLPAIWRPPDYQKTEYASLINIFHQLDLAVTLGNTPTTALKFDNDEMLNYTTLLPCLFPEDKPSGTETALPMFPSRNEQQYTTIFKFSFLPKSIISRLFCKVIYCYGKPLYYWRNGIILQIDQGKLAIVSSRKKITVTMRFPLNQLQQAVGIYENIIKLLEQVHSAWKGISVCCAVACCHCISQRNNPPTIFTLDQVNNSNLLFCSNNNSNKKAMIVCAALIPRNWETLYAKNMIGSDICTANSILLPFVQHVDKPSESDYQLLYAIYVLRNIRSNYLLNVEGISSTTSSLYVVTEKVDCHDDNRLTLAMAFTSEDKFTHNKKLQIAINIVCGLKELSNHFPIQPVHAKRYILCSSVLLVSTAESNNVAAKISLIDAMLANKSSNNGNSKESRAVTHQGRALGIVLSEIWAHSCFTAATTATKVGEDEESEILQFLQSSDDCPEAYVSLVTNCCKQEIITTSFLEHTEAQLVALLTTNVASNSDIYCANTTQLIDATAVVFDKTTITTKSVITGFYHISVDSSLFVLCICLDGSILQYDLQGNLQQTYDNIHTKAVRQLIQVGNTIWTCAADSIINMCAMRKAKLVAKKQAYFDVLSLCEVGKYVWAGAVDTFIFIFDKKSMKKKTQILLSQDVGITAMCHDANSQIVWAAAYGLFKICAKTNQILCKNVRYRSCITSMALAHSALITVSNNAIKFWNNTSVDCVKYIECSTPILQLIGTSSCNKVYALKNDCAVTEIDVAKHELNDNCIVELLRAEVSGEGATLTALSTCRPMCPCRPMCSQGQQQHNDNNDANDNGDGDGDAYSSFWLASSDKTISIYKPKKPQTNTKQEEEE